MSNKVFDAFFWIEPVRVNKKLTTTKVLWHFPEDVSKVVNEFPDLAEFCFPDMQRITLEKAQTTRSEHYIFTLNDKAGVRVYGVCMRGLFRGVNRRYDVKRRTRHCLCIITRYPFFKMFKNVLLELHAIALLEETPGCCRQFIEYFYNKCVMSSVKDQLVLIPKYSVLALYNNLTLVCPKFSSVNSGMSSKEVSILPLFDVLGVERFFKLLSAVLCEKRIVFIADAAETLSTTVLAAATLSHPFKWHHTFIPLLPEKLLNYLSNPSPYMIGIRRYLVSELKKEHLDGVLTVDVNSGDVCLHGSAGTTGIRDLIGDSASARKQASESIDQMKAKVSNMFYGKSSTSSNEAAEVGPKDIMMAILSDLKSNVVNTKPGTTFSSLLKGDRSLEESKMQWSVESEKVIKDNLTCFFVYFFGDLDDYIDPSVFMTGTSSNGFGSIVKPTINPKPASSSASPLDHLRSFGPDDSRSKFDLKAFIYKRIQIGDSKNLITFLCDFVYSQMFEKYCSELIQKCVSGKLQSTANLKRQSMGHFRPRDSVSMHGTMNAQRNTKSLPSTVSGSNSNNSLSDSGHEDIEGDIFESACHELKSRLLMITVSNVRSAVTFCSTASSSVDETNKEMCSSFHALTVQYTTGATSLAPFELDAETDSQYYISNTGNLFVDAVSTRENHKRLSVTNGFVRKIIADSCNSDNFIRILNTIGFRLQSCLAASCRGSAAISGIRALILCRFILIEGPVGSLSYIVDLIPTLRGLLQIRQMVDSSSKQQQAMEYMSLGALVDVTKHAKLVLDLIVDHKKLNVQRKIFSLMKNNQFTFITEVVSDTNELVPASCSRKEMLLNGSFGGSKQFPIFSNLHESLNVLKLSSVAKGILNLTVPELAIGSVDDRGEGEDDDEPSLKLDKKQQQQYQQQQHHHQQQQQYQQQQHHHQQQQYQQQHQQQQHHQQQQQQYFDTSNQSRTSVSINNPNQSRDSQDNIPVKPLKPVKPVKPNKITPTPSVDNLIDFGSYSDPVTTESSRSSSVTYSNKSNDDLFASDPFANNPNFQANSSNNAQFFPSEFGSIPSPPVTAGKITNNTSPIPPNKPSISPSTAIIRPPPSGYGDSIAARNSQLQHRQTDDPFASLNPMSMSNPR